MKIAYRMAKEDVDEGRATYADPDPLYSANRKTSRVVFFTNWRPYLSGMIDKASSAGIFSGRWHI